MRLCEYGIILQEFNYSRIPVFSNFRAVIFDSNGRVFSASESRPSIVKSLDMPNVFRHLDITILIKI